jgi:hypothetical protein
MLPSIATGNVGSALAGEYEVANSVRMSNTGTTYFTRTYGTPTNNLKYTRSFWVKRSGLTDINKGFIASSVTNANTDYFYFNASDQILVGNTTSPSTTAKFRDISAWLHCVVIFDSANATAADRTILYINNVRQTLSTTISLNSTGGNQDGIEYQIGRQGTNTRYLDGYLAEYVFVDGQALTPDNFGESDEDSGIWKPKDLSGLTFGNNGYYLDFEDSSALGNDVSGNNNDWTPNNLTSVDQSTDTCTNNFCTLNALNSIGTSGLNTVTMSEGNLKGVGTADFDTAFGTMAVQNGVWYYEVEFDTTGSGYCAGWTTTDEMQNIGASGDVDQEFAGFLNNIRVMNWGTEELADYANVAAGDILGLELDLDSATKTLKCYHNGTLKATVNLPTDKGDTWIPVMGDTGTSDPTFIANFGNPIVSLSSANSDPAGYGSFEYSTGSGYSLCTKNLAEYG